jgi:hypothetical protein
MLVTERSGHIRIIDKSGHLLPDPVKNTPTPWVRQDGGFFDIAISPDYKRDGWIYLSYSEVMPGYTGALPPANAARPAAGAPPIPNPPSMTRIVRAHLNARARDICSSPWANAATRPMRSGLIRRWGKSIASTWTVRFPPTILSSARPAP